jgi:hypothetical protein
MRNIYFKTLKTLPSSLILFCLPFSAYSRFSHSLWVLTPAGV